MTTATSIRPLFQEVMLATDFSQDTDRAMQYARAIIQGTDAELLLTHVASPPAYVAIPEGGWIDDGSLLKAEEEKVEAAGIALRAEGLKAKSLCCYGGVTTEIAREASQNHADLVIAGTQGKTGLARFFLGSHAESMMHQLALPVMVVGPGCPAPAQAEWKPQNILCRVRLTPDGADAAAFACRMAQHYGSHVAVAYVRSSKDKHAFATWTEFRRAVHERLSWEGGVAPAMHEILLHEGSPESLVNLAIARDTDLIIVQARHTLLDWPDMNGPLPRLLSEAPCPLMTAPQPATDQTSRG